ncbi:MAG TPA: hypothetical protein VK680_07780, partial [Solirubrobacteraceae bacterium]|nr:hypothetical protein [Solirubrobacteraceae bacterium]
MHISRRRTPTPASTDHPVPHNARTQSSGTGGWLRPGWRRAAMLAGGVLALAAAPAALAGSLDAAGGQAVRGGVKNPSRGGYIQTTQIW